MSPNFSVVITAHQQPAQLLKCLDALGRQSLARHQFEIIVVDDGDSPTTAAAVVLFTRQLNRQHGKLEIRYLPQPIRRGAAAARNLGWKAAQGRIIAFTDDNFLPQPDWLASARSNFANTTEFVTRTVTATARPAVLLPPNYFYRKSTLEQLGGFPESINDEWTSDTFIDQFTQHVAEYDTMATRRLLDQAGECISADQQSLPVHWAAISGALTGLVGLLTGGLLLATAGFSVWILLATLFGQSQSLQILSHPSLFTRMITRLVTPFVLVYEQLHSTLKYSPMQ
jgi:glycosyltransferase involved in cell wall biosynthesis